MPRAVVLFSGGLDSATTLAWAIRDGLDAYALTFRYGQRHAIEVTRALILAKQLGAAEHRVVDLDLGFLRGSALLDRSMVVPKDRPPEADNIPVTYVPARNLVFLSIGLAWAEALEAREIWLGVNAVDFSGYPDCRSDFLAAFERAATLGTRPDGSRAAWRVRAPLGAMTKGQIVRAALELGVDVALTWSCYDPTPSGDPCRRCDSCAFRSRGFQEAGLVDPAGPVAGSS